MQLEENYRYGMNRVNRLGRGGGGVGGHLVLSGYSLWRESTCMSSYIRNGRDQFIVGVEHKGAV